MEHVEEDVLDHVPGRRLAPGTLSGMPAQICDVVPVKFRECSGVAVIDWGGRRNSVEGVHGRPPSRDGGYVVGE
jgi:hypothetical protein